MIWALLAILGVPIWLIVGALGSVLLSRRRFRAQAGVFPLAVRSAGQDSWPRMVTYGRIVRDILVVNQGLALVRTEVYPIVDVRPSQLDTEPKKIDDPTGRLLSIDGRDDIEVAVSSVVAAELDECRRPSSA